MIHVAMAALVLCQNDAKDEVAKVLKKAGEWDSYAFAEAFQASGSADGDDATEKSEGQYQKDVGLAVKDADGQTIKVGKTEVRKAEGGEWKKPKRPGFGFGGLTVVVGDGGGPRKVRTLEPGRPPHEDLAALADRIVSAKTKDATEKVGDIDCVVFECDVKPEKNAARGLQFGVGLGGGKNGAGRIEETKNERTLKLWVDDDYRVRKFEVATNVEGTWGGDEFKTKTTRTVELSKIGETKVEVPEAARKALEAKED